MKSIGQEVISKETLRHIAYFRAISDGASEETLLKIKERQLLEEDLNRILNSEFTCTDLEHFHEKPKDKCRKCRQDIEADQAEWNSEDGMTDSVMSTEDDKWRLMLIKQGDNDYREEKVSKNDQLVGIDGHKGPNFKEKLMDLIENIDDISEKVQKMKITKSQFVDCLRDMTKDKIMTVKESKTVFEARIKKLIKAQDYEIGC